jgi:hypothetical protein
MSVTVETTGAYSVAATTPAWTFGGNLAKTLSSVTQVNGTDKLGAYTGITFNLTGTGALQGTIRLYAALPVAMFSMKTLAQMATLGVNFPDITTYPTSGMYYMGQRNNTFSVPTFTLSQVGDNSALASFNAQGETFIYSAADHFWEVSTTYSGALRSTIKQWATPLPSGWDHQAILAVGKGINHVFDVWGEGLRGYYGKPLPSNQDELPLRTLGYWTDNQAGYYYYVDPAYANYEEEMMAVKNYFQNTLKLPLGYLMLDSWWYKKGCSQVWNAVGSGIYLYQAHPQVFPSGLNGFHNRIGIPFVTHHRWYETSCSPIATRYGLSGGLPLKYTAWKEIISGVADSGSITFEQDWLDNNARVAQHICDLDSAMGNMARVCAEKKITQQYCMATPMYYQQAMKYPTLTTMRTCNDGYKQSLWNDHIFNSRFSWSAGMFPWVDCFKSSSKGCVVSAVVAANYFPPSDRIGAEVVANILPATRKDGILVHPDVPAVPTDNTYINFGRALTANPVTRTWTDHGNNLKTWYLWVPGANATSYTFNLAQEGVVAPSGVYAYNWFTKTGKTVAAGGQLSDACAYGTDLFHYWVVAPISACGIAFLGDLSKYASCGRNRITALTHSATQVVATVDLEAPELNVTLSGYATEKPNAVCSGNATLGTVSFANNIFSVVLQPKAGARTPMTVAFGKDPLIVGTVNPMVTAATLSVTIASAGNVLTVSPGFASSYSVQVLDLSGKLVRAGTAGKWQAWSAVVPAGATYLVQIKTPSGTLVKKCVLR